MGLINMLFIVIAVQVLFLVCMPAHEAWRILYAENKNVINNYKAKLFWAVQQGEASLNVPNLAITGDISSSVISQKAILVTDHNIGVSPLTRRLLLNGHVPPSAPNAPTWIPPKSHRAPPDSLGSKQKSTPSSSLPKGSTSIP